MAEVTRRKYLGGSAVVLGGLLAAACGEESGGGGEESGGGGEESGGGGETQPAAQPKPATQAPAQPAQSIGPKTIGFHTDWVSPKRKASIDRALKIWEQMHPEWKIQGLFVPGQDDNLSQVVISMAAGTEGDITLWEMYAVELWASRGAFLDVTAAVKKNGYNIEDHYYAPWTAFYQGKQIGMPFQWNVQYWQFNKTIFDRFQAPYPPEDWSWEDIPEIAKSVTRKEENIWGVNFGDTPFWSTYLLWDAPVLNEDFSKSGFDTPNGLAMLEWYHDLIFKHGVAPKYDEWREKLSKEGGIVAFGNGSGVPWGRYKSTLENNSFELDVATLPVLKRTGKKISGVFDQPHMVLRAAERHDVVDEVSHFLFFMAGDEMGQILSEELPGGIPSKKSIVHSKEHFLRTPPEHVDRVLESFTNMVPAYPPFPHTLPWINAHRFLVRELWSGKLSPRAFAQQADVAVDQALQGAPDAAYRRS